MRREFCAAVVFAVIFLMPQVCSVVLHTFRFSFWSCFCSALPPRVTLHTQARQQHRWQKHPRSNNVCISSFHSHMASLSRHVSMRHCIHHHRQRNHQRHLRGRYLQPLLSPCSPSSAHIFRHSRRHRVNVWSRRTFRRHQPIHGSAIINAGANGLGRPAAARQHHCQRHCSRHKQRRRCAEPVSPFRLQSWNTVENIAPRHVRHAAAGHRRRRAVFNHIVRATAASRTDKL